MIPHSSVHHTEQGILLNQPHPDPDTQARLEYDLLQIASEGPRFDYIATETPTLNEQYRSEVATIEQQLKRDFGEKMGHFTTHVLAEAEFETLAQLRYDGDPVESTQGFAYRGHIILRADEQMLQDFGSPYLIGVGLHEGSHIATMGEEHTFITTRQVPSEVPMESSGDPELSGELELNVLHGYGKNRRSDDFAHQFWGEALADSYRVRALGELGMQWKIDASLSMKNPVAGHTIDFTNSSAEADLAHKYEPGHIYLPLKYAVGVTYNEEMGTARVKALSPAFGAYGLDLLDAYVPGLYEDLKNASHSPDAERSFIRKVESVQPGLYPALRNLPYTDEGFIQGLVTIRQALDLRAQ